MAPPIPRAPGARRSENAVYVAWPPASSHLRSLSAGGEPEKYHSRRKSLPSGQGMAWRRALPMLAYKRHEVGN